MTSKTVYCLTPREAEKVGINPEQKLIVALTPAQTKQIKLQPDNAEFRKIYCASCPRYMSETELLNAMREIKLAATIPNKLKYSNENGVCNAMDKLIATCYEGHSITEHQIIELNVPELLWVYNYGASGREQWQLFAHKDGEIKPYRVGNVYASPEAAICWSKNQPKPAHLRQAYFDFWNAPFSNELTNRPKTEPGQPSLSLSQLYTSYNVDRDDSSQWRPLPNITWLPPKDGIFFSDSPNIISSLPARVLNDQNYIYGTIQQGEGENWLFYTEHYLLSKTGKLSGTGKLQTLAKL